MIKNKFVLAIGAAFLASALALPATVHADTTKSTNAFINVTQPATHGELTLTSAPTFNFSATVDTLNTQALPGTTNSPVTVNDARDTNAGWSLMMTLGDFTNKNTAKGADNGTYMNWSGSLGAGSSTVKQGVSQVSAGGAATSIMDATPGTGNGVTELNFNSVQLHATGLTPIITRYSTVVRWTLGASQQTMDE